MYTSIDNKLICICPECKYKLSRVLSCRYRYTKNIFWFEDGYNLKVKL